MSPQRFPFFLPSSMVLLRGNRNNNSHTHDHQRFAERLHEF